MVVRPAVLLAALACIAAGCAPGDEPEPPESLEFAERRAETPEGFSLYRNDRFDYAVAYPDSLLVPLGESANGDGQRFASPDERVELSAFGRPLMPVDSVEAIFAERMQSRREEEGLVVYSARDDSAFVISGTSGDRIYYERSIINDTRVATIVLTYPIPMRPVMRDIVADVAGSFGAPPP